MINSVRSGTVCIPNVILKSTLKASSDMLHYCHLNAGSLPPKIDEFRSYFEDTCLDVIVASETWLKSYHSDKFVSLPGFDIVRNDRHAKRSGGVIVYVRQGINYKVVKVSEKISSEYVFIEIIFPNSKLLVGAYYKAPRVAELDVFKDVLLGVTVPYDDVLLLGDFNENQLRSVNGSCPRCVNGTCSFCEFAGIVEQFGLTSVGTIPSHYPVGERPSLIDLCLTNKPEKVVFFNQISHGLSKHDLIFGSYICNKGSSEGLSRLRRNFFKVNKEALHSHVNSIDWSCVFDAESVTDKVEIFNDVLMSTLDVHAPLLPVKKRDSLALTKPWFNGAIRRALLERDIAEFEYRNGCATLDHYRRLRNHATNLIKRAKSDYLSPKLDPKLGSRALWRNLREVGAVSTSGAKPGFTADDYNVYITSSVDSNPVTRVPSTTIVGRDSGFSFSNVTSLDVIKAVKSIRSNSLGLDNMPLTFIKMVLPFILPVLTHIINHCFTSSSVPRAWKLSKVLPVHKKTRSRRLDDFRPISILPCLSKVFEILAKEQLTAYLDSNRLLDDFQSGFRAFHGTNAALLRVSDEIRKSFEKKFLTVMVLLDFSKAFDSLNHRRLLYKLGSAFAFSSSALTLVRDYLTDRFQCVCIDGHFSDLSEVKAGIPQGSVLGPLLFSLYINDLPGSLKFASHHMFADDVQLFLACAKNKINEGVFRVNQDLYAVCRWARENGLKLNSSKTQAIIFSETSERLSSAMLAPRILLDGKVIPYVDKVLNLGLTMDKKMMFTDQANEVCSKVFGRLRSLWQCSHLFSLKTRIMLVKSLVLPAFTYGDSVYSTNLSASAVRSLERAFSACVRFVYRLKRYDSTRDYVNEILGCPLMAYLKLRCCAHIYNVAKRREPGFLYERLCAGNSTRSRNYVLPRHTSVQYNRSFFVRAVSDFNSLPANVRGLPTVAMFRDASVAFFQAS